MKTTKNPKANCARPSETASTSIDSQPLGDLLDGFSTQQQLVIIEMTEGKPTRENIRAIPVRTWKKCRNMGDGFISKLLMRGLIQDGPWRAFLFENDKRELIQKDRELFTIQHRIDQARLWIMRWERELQLLEKEILELKASVENSQAQTAMGYEKEKQLLDKVNEAIGRRYKSRELEPQIDLSTE